MNAHERSIVVDLVAQLERTLARIQKRAPRLPDFDPGDQIAKGADVRATLRKIGEDLAPWDTNVDEARLVSKGYAAGSARSIAAILRQHRTGTNVVTHHTLTKGAR